METYLIDVPVPSMGATVNELTVIDLLVAPGARIAKGQKMAEMESDKSIFDFEAPCDGTVVAVQGRAGDIMPSGVPFLRIETADGSLKHLQVKESKIRSQKSGKAARSVTPMTAPAPAPSPATPYRVPSVAGPKRPQDRIELPGMKESFVGAFTRPVAGPASSIKRGISPGSYWASPSV